MRLTFKRLMAVLCTFLFILSCIFVSSTSENYSGTKSTETARYQQLISVTPNVVQSIGTILGGASCHGGNQNRVASVPGATYVAVLTGEKPESDFGEGEFSFIQVKDDGTIKNLVTEMAIGANVNGVTCTCMVDANEDIWCYVGWDDYVGCWVTNLWFYDVSEDKVTKYTDRETFYYGGSYGYSVASLDIGNGKIYATISGGSTPGWWNLKSFDLETKTWTPMMALKLPSRAQYCEGFPNGYGGLIVVANRGPSYRATKCDTGEFVSVAVDRLHNQKEFNNYTFDSVYVADIFHPDSGEKKTEDFQLIDVETPIYDVERGLYPQINHYWQGDVYRDTKGYLHVLYSCDDNNGIYGTPLYTKTFASNPDGLVELEKNEVNFLYGFNAGYSCRWFEDTKGNLYLFAAVNSGKMEIWKANNELGTSFDFVYEFTMPGISGYYPFHIANARNNSTPSDVATLLVHGKFEDTEEDDWHVVKIDLGGLMELKGGKQ